jgi:hypothetical protein
MKREIHPTWIPMQKKVSFFCPACDRKLGSVDPLIPYESSCPKCNEEFAIKSAVYPMTKFLGFLLVLILISGVSLPFMTVAFVLCAIICPLIYANSKRRFKIDNLSYLTGSIASTGWILALVLRVLLEVSRMMTASN